MDELYKNSSASFITATIFVTVLSLVTSVFFIVRFKKLHRQIQSWVFLLSNVTGVTLAWLSFWSWRYWGPNKYSVGILSLSFAFTSFPYLMAPRWYVDFFVDKYGFKIRPQKVIVTIIIRVICIIVLIMQVLIAWMMFA